MILNQTLENRIPNTNNSIKTSTRRKQRGVRVTPAPLSKSYRVVSSPAVVNGTQSFRVQHTETVSAITNGLTTTFCVVPQSLAQPGLDFNPGCVQLFPWLSALAVNFEKYHFNSLSFELVPSSPATVPGRVYMAIDYDYNDNPSVSKVQLTANRSCVSGSVWQSLMLRADSKAMHSDMPQKYTSISSRPNFIDPRTAYCGFLLIAVESTTTNVNFDLRVTYDVSLYLPQLESNALKDGTLIAPAAVADVTTAVGTGFAGLPAPLPNATLTGKFVVPGSGTVPLLDFQYLGGPMSASSALDIRDVRSSVVSFVCKAGVTGKAPADLLNDGLLGFLRGFDSDGRDLGILPATCTDMMGGVDAPTDISLPGAVMRVVMNLYTTASQSVWPTLRYVFPVLTSAAALGSGASGYGIKSEL